MKRNKQRKSEIKLRRWQRQEAQRAAISAKALPAGTRMADMARLVLINGSFVWHPGYYEDIDYRCRDCGAQCVWTASDQKWWHEQVQGSLDAHANRCKGCRANYRAWRLSHCNAQEMAALRALWRERPDRAARERVEQGLTAKDPAIRCLSAQALAWWCWQFDDEKAHERLDSMAFEKSWAPRIRRILQGKLELRPGVQRVCRAASTLPANA